MVDDTETQRRAQLVRGLLYLACPEASSYALHSTAGAIVGRSEQRAPLAHAVSEAERLTNPRPDDDPPRILSGAELAGAELAGADLRGADLTGANVAGADLAGANLSGADLTGANLSGADLTGVNLTSANLFGANLNSANVSRANLVGANLTSTNVAGADFTRANLASAKLRRQWRLRWLRLKEKVRASVKADASRPTPFRSPAGFGAELTRLIQDGDLGRISELVGQLPAWPVREPLRHAAQWMAEMTMSAGVADSAGVQRDVVDKVRASVESATTAVSAVAVKILLQANDFGDEWQGLTDESRQALEWDAQQLRQLSAAATSLRDSLGVAVTDLGNGIQAQTAARDLQSLAEAIRHLTRPP
ncbi:pentapeptide repeat-containing protein [Streptomyces iakyrus]|uniref:pentapeptide repeat-containing protein n=1 Tax=Streptomyces iakyrus TaxID=68219 RepID=UPI0033F9027C